MRLSPEDICTYAETIYLQPVLEDIVAWQDEPDTDDITYSILDTVIDILIDHANIEEV